LSYLRRRYSTFQNIEVPTHEAERYGVPRVKLHTDRVLLNLLLNEELVTRVQAWEVYGTGPSTYLEVEERIRGKGTLHLKIMTRVLPDSNSTVYIWSSSSDLEALRAGPMEFVAKIAKQLLEHSDFRLDLLSSRIPVGIVDIATKLEDPDMSTLAELQVASGRSTILSYRQWDAILDPV
jgi:hypothetical protein